MKSQFEGKDRFKMVPAGMAKDGFIYRVNPSFAKTFPLTEVILINAVVKWGWYKYDR